jgi:hypothetical protein
MLFLLTKHSELVALCGHRKGLGQAGRGGRGEGEATGPSTVGGGGWWLGHGEAGEHRQLGEAGLARCGSGAGGQPTVGRGTCKLRETDVEEKPKVEDEHEPFYLNLTVLMCRLKTKQTLAL